MKVKTRILDFTNVDKSPGAIAYAKARGNPLAVEVPNDPPPTARPGLYKQGTALARVRPGYGKRVYAEVLNPISGGFSYARGLIYHLKPEDRLSKAEALGVVAEYAAEFDRCLCCGHALTSPESRAIGVGPTCLRWLG